MIYGMSKFQILIAFGLGMRNLGVEVSAAAKSKQSR